MYTSYVILINEKKSLSKYTNNNKYCVKMVKTQSREWSISTGKNLIKVTKTIWGKSENNNK